MQFIFEELDFQQTPFGEISLRRRSEPRLDNKVIYEVKLGDEFLMSSLFVEAEEQLSTLGLQALKDGGLNDQLNVVVGGLGLGYTALTALSDSSVRRLRVIDVMQPVIDWHQQGILPIGDVLSTDVRCELLRADFFAVATDAAAGIVDDEPVHAVLLDIDHSPGHWLKQSNSDFYSAESLGKMSDKIVPNGVFGLWSNERPDQGFVQHLEQIFTKVEAHLIEFDNPYSGGSSINSVYISIVWLLNLRLIMTFFKQNFLWIFYAVFVAAALIMHTDDGIETAGALALGKPIIWIIWGAFLVYSYFGVHVRENFFDSLKKLYPYLWHRQIGLDLYIGLLIPMFIIYLHEGSILVLLLWFLPLLAFVNLTSLLYMVLNYDGLVAHFL